MSARPLVLRPVRRPMRNRQRGASIVIAVFFLLLFAALALYMQWMVSASHRGSAQDVQGARAYQAARSGMEFGLYRLQRDGACADEANLTFSGSSLSDFTTTVSCRKTGDTTELLPDTLVCVYEIVSTACNRPINGNCADVEASGGDYHERQIRVSTEYLVDDGSLTACP